MADQDRKPIPKHVEARVLRVLRAAKANPQPCYRCGGEGYLDREDWVETEGDGRKGCFACKGSGEAKRKTFGELVSLRLAFAYRLKPLMKAGNADEIMRIEDEEKERIYYPLLTDVFERASNAAERIAGA